MDEGITLDQAMAERRGAPPPPEREDRLDGLHPAIEKAEPRKEFTSDRSGLHKAAEHYRRSNDDPVAKEHFGAILENGGVDRIGHFDKNGIEADPKATFRQSDLRSVADGKARYTERKQQWISEVYAAAAQGRDPSPEAAELNQIRHRAEREFGDLSAEEFEALRDFDPEKYQRGLALRERLGEISSSLPPSAEQQHEHQQQRPQPADPERLAQAQARLDAQVNAEQERLREQQTRATLTQWRQTLDAEARHIVSALQHFPELSRGVTPQQLEQHLRTTDPQRHALLRELSQRSGAVLAGAQQQHAVATQFEASSNVAQRQQFEAHKNAESEKVLQAHPQYRDPVKRAQLGADLLDYFTNDLKLPMQQLKWHHANNPHFHSAEFQNILIDAVAHRKAQKQMAARMAELNAHRRPLPPVQRPGAARDARRDGSMDDVKRAESARNVHGGFGLKEAKALLQARRRAGQIRTW